MGCRFSNNTTKGQTVPNLASSSSEQGGDKATTSIPPSGSASLIASKSPSSPNKAPEDRPISTTGVERACFGAGCYWGTEKYMRDFSKKNSALGTLMSATVGFMGPADAPANPTYQQVCSGSTGHVEVLQVEYKGGNSYFEEMVRFFFQFHDPTTPNRQGNDKGSQYASFVFVQNDAQREIAERVKEELQRHLDDGKVTCFQEKQVSLVVWADMGISMVYICCLYLCLLFLH
ncbi:peptide-methionine (S)-S-oxide reductase [archaeon]|nr:MAG: peptide-methionine (S)-S-oxide reductase [archaeon]